MLAALEHQQKLTPNQWKIISATVLGDMLDFFDYGLIAFALAFIRVDLQSPGKRIARQIHPPGSGVSAISPVKIEKLSAAPMNTVRRPMRSASQPQISAPGTAPMPAASKIIAD